MWLVCLPRRSWRVFRLLSWQCGWRTLTGLADFALIDSYLSTAAKWGISKLDALRDLFNGNASMPPGLEPAG